MLTATLLGVSVASAYAMVGDGLDSLIPNAAAAVPCGGELLLILVLEEQGRLGVGSNDTSAFTLDFHDVGLRSLLKRRNGCWGEGAYVATEGVGHLVYLLQGEPRIHEAGESRVTRAGSEVVQPGSFRQLSPTKIQALILGLQELPVRAGQTIVKQGDPGDNYYIILRGECEVVRENARVQPRLSC